MQNEASRFDELTTEEMLNVDGGLATVALVVGIVAGIVTIAVGTNEIITSVIEHKAQHDAMRDLGLIN